MKTYRKFMWMIVIALLCFGYRQQMVHADVLAVVNDFTFFTPIDHAPNGDTFEYENTINFSGKIVYSPIIIRKKGEESSSPRFIVIRTLLNGKQVSVRALQVKTSGNVYGFQFSPNGRYVLFKIGTPLADPADPYFMFFWDTTANKILPGPQNPKNMENTAFYRVRWSPSGRYIAYCRGGDVNGNEYPFPNDYRPLSLYTYDLETGKEHFIAKASSVRYFTWTNSDKLLFSMRSAEYAKQQHKTIATTDDERSSLLNIYQSLPTGKDIQLLIKDGFVVYPSPDGTKFIFMSHEDIDERQHRKKYEAPPEHTYVEYLHPILYDSKNHTFKAIPNAEGIASWMPSGNKLLLAQYEYHSDNKGILIVKQLNLSDRKQKQIAQFEVQDISPFTESISYHQFDKLTFSKNLRYLFVKAIRQGKLITTSVGVHYHDRFELIKVADLQSSKVSTICTIHRFAGFGWYNLH